MNQPIQLIPEYRDYVWGGDKLRPGYSPTAEVWAVYENDRVAAGPQAGRSLAELAAEDGEKFLGKYVQQQTGGRFPLLIKLLDCAQWLSVQVHPNDEQAVRLEGAGFFGKTEAWHVLGAEPEAQLIAGMKPGVSAEALSAGIADGTILTLSQYLDVSAGETIFIRPGTIHALGPGLLIYEVQQSSDLTYRVYDWGRPQTEKRKLHIEKSLAVTDPRASTQVVPNPVLADGECRVLVHNSYFKLEIMAAETLPITLDTGGQTFHALTLIEGQAQVTVASGPGSWKLGRFETILIPAACGAYRIEPIGAFRALKSSVEPV
ncbi:MAG: class I mannose-6-phosphate isomerase [Chloroflexi bacterium]|nr:class I mannose-6-phosphate isomerase [Chloroflexota bacterium]